jgi:hypothetical protein
VTRCIAPNKRSFTTGAIAGYSGGPTYFIVNKSVDEQLAHARVSAELRRLRKASKLYIEPDQWRCTYFLTSGLQAGYYLMCGRRHNGLDRFAKECLSRLDSKAAEAASAHMSKWDEATERVRAKVVSE